MSRGAVGRVQRRPPPPRVVRALSSVAVGAAVAVVAAFFLPWARSGRAERSGFALARVVDTLGLADTFLLRGLLVAFWFSPLLVGLAWTAAALGRHRTAGALGACVGAVAVAGAILVFRAGAVEATAGTWVGIVTGLTALGAGLPSATIMRR